jgi:hypothetical protein
LYNALIKQVKKIMAVEIDPAELIPCGVPDEYTALKARLEV